MGSMANSEATNRDRIRELPDEHVLHIISLLPTVDAVRTTVLSKKWNRRWTKFETLDFDNRRDFRRHTNLSTFVTFVSRVLYYRDATPILLFRLKMSRCRYLPCVGHWIQAAVRRGVVELDLHLDFNNWADFKLPLCIFGCKTLEVLKLTLRPWTVEGEIPSLGRFPKLRFLHVKMFDPEKNEMEKLLSHFPVLEELTIDGTSKAEIIYGSTTSNFLFSAPKLKTLKIGLEGLHEPIDIHVCAPELENINLQRLGLTKCFLDGSTDSLVTASITFREYVEEYKEEYDGYTMELLKQVSDVKCLSVSAHHLKDLYLPENWLLPSFGNVNQLTLVFGDHSCWELLAQFLNNACNLEVLVLDDTSERTEDDEEIHWNPPEEVSGSLSPNLKTIVLKGFKGRRCEMRMIKYLLKIGQLLNKMTISPGRHLSYNEQNEFYTEFMMFNRAETCHIEFMQMQV
ncbi:F-box/LRR-repeat protein At3g26922-like [Argentina anserina]|uniref:F-box/LRR-repeat protein At3g26922-like n=1 Tax=Argentina anserina TaxID=57926 RepID=UPI0021766D9B|nr:F-box/LRR-repeat protein At3g26922-like [Potentilla anserina]